MDKFSDSEVLGFMDIIETVYDKLDVSARTWHDRKAEIFQLCKQEEVNHRRVNQGKYRLTVNQAAKLHVIKWVAYGLTEPNRWGVGDLMVCPLGVIMAYAFGVHYSDAIKEGWSGIDISTIKALDYARLV